MNFLKRFVVKGVRIGLIAGAEFMRDNCLMRASSLTFYALLALAPIAAMLFAIARGFGVETLLREELMNRFQEQSAVLEQVFGFAQELLNGVRGGVITGIGILILFFTTIRVFATIEETFNQVWGVSHGRSWGRKFTDYLSMMLICPILLIVASGLTVWLASGLPAFLQKLGIGESIVRLLLLAFKLTPYLLTWILFTFLYLFIPNTRIRFSAALFGGVVAGSLYQIMQWLYVMFQVEIARQNAIYGSFVALPLFLLWLQASWVIALLGAELGYAFQNLHLISSIQGKVKLSHTAKKLLVVQIMHLITKQFYETAQPMLDEDVIRKMGIYPAEIEDLIKEMLDAHLLLEVRVGESSQKAYLPAEEPSRMTLVKTIEKWENCGSTLMLHISYPDEKKLSEALEKLRFAEKISTENKLLKDL